jgi:ABC-type branched-subunit amino acid transport system substrate-binding protein
MSAWASRLLAFLAASGWLFAGAAAGAEEPALKIAVQSSLTGASSAAGGAFLDAIKFAIDEANATSTPGPKFALEVFDDASTDDGAASAARAVVASDAAVVLGPARTPLAIVAAPVFGGAAMPMVATTLHADELTLNPTTFRTVISTGEIGEALAGYLGRILRGKRALVFSVDNGYGRPLAERFKAAADRQGLEVEYRVFATKDQRDAIAKELGAAPDQAPIVLGMEYEDAAPVLKTLRRMGYQGLVMGTATMARANFNSLFAKEPEEQATPGVFTEGVYATSPMILDSANAEILDFARRFEARFGHEPSWESVQAYDGALLAMKAMRDALALHPDLAGAGARAWRAATLDAIKAFDSPARAVAGLNGLIWFTPDRIRRQAVRIGRFHAGVFESAPLQLVPVADPDPGEIATGEVFETEPGEYHRLQRVVQTGTFLNLIPRIDLPKSTFGADFYLWLRFAHDAGPGAIDPTDLVFPNMTSGRFDPKSPAESTLMPDGTEYRLWRVQGEFRTDYDLHKFPFDSQGLKLQFFNARASSDRVVYVLDRRSTRSGADASEAPQAGSGGSSFGVASAAAAAAAGPRGGASLAAPGAFVELTQWDPSGAQERRDTLVTHSSLGDLRRIGLQTPRELSGFLVTYEVERRTAASLVKTLLPMLLMCVVMYSTLHFPHALTKEKVTVCVTAALSAAVLLAAVNNQLGALGYTIAVEYVFYVFFGLALLCIFYVAAFERLRLSGHEIAAGRLELGTRALFLATVAATIASAAIEFGSV